MESHKTVGRMRTMGAKESGFERMGRLRLTQHAIFVGLTLALIASSAWSFLFFHTVSELLSIIVGFSAFVIAFNAAPHIGQRYHLALGMAAIAAAAIDLVHTLAFRGMNILPGVDTNAPTQLWIAARALQAASLVWIAWRPERLYPLRRLLPAYSLATLILLASILVWPVFPDCYIEGKGLTPFKIGAEYVISGLFLASAFLLYRNRQAFDPATWRFLIGSSLAMALAEIAFTIYVDVYGLSSIVGHVAKILAFYLLYLALVEKGIAEPQRDLFLMHERERESLLLRLEEKQMHEISLRRAKIEAERANQAKSEFLSNMSHELRTPLNAIMGFSELLETLPKEMAAAKQAEYLRHIRQASDHLLRLIDDVLDLSRVEAQRLDLQMEPVGIRTALREAVGLVRPLAADRAIDIAVVEDGFEPKVMADGNRLRQVLINLLSNAIKYNVEGGRVTVTLGLASADRVRLTVRDTGIGIAPEKMGVLFQPFSRIDADKHAIPGTGIGLSLSKKLIELMGGRIEADSVPDEGSRFSIELPLAPPG